ncbi:vitamin K epoxide reductase family protein [Saccharopolyspora gregorii]|uniref:vitamin K epoxide reductase family protein n=1 Tax=Saccharopolyspora gregorii TaxID=33914 RepID=UPI0021AB9E55|nr:vitamin K epoxide reductase family protein [Saccharopolyspora gregorii]
MTATEQARAAAPAPAPAPARGLGWLYVIGGAIGLVSAFALTIEKINKLGDPNYVPSCSLNPIISCGSVMDSAQAALFGFPNPLIGVAAFPALMAAGAALLAGLTAPRWFWLGLQLGSTLGVVFVHWLIVQSLYEIGALCPYCMVVWAVTIPIFWYTTLHVLRSGHLGGGRALGAALAKFHSFALLVWYLVIVVLVLQAFWSYWISLV